MLLELWLGESTAAHGKALAPIFLSVFPRLRQVQQFSSDCVGEWNKITHAFNECDDFDLYTASESQEAAWYAWWLGTTLSQYSLSVERIHLFL